MKNLRNKLLCALAATAGVFIPAQVSAQESAQIAAWTFSGGYERVDEGTSAYFTPSSGQWAESGVVWFKDYAPYIYPTAKADGQDGAVLTAMYENRYWQIVDNNNGDKVLRIENAAANTITDYTDASQHNVYYEAKFSTTGYKDITLTYEMACGANTEAAIEAVISTDGGTTWFDAGQGKTTAQWWVFNQNEVKMSANNKEQVVVRLIAGNDLASNWNLKSLTVSGTPSEEAKPIDVQGATVAWPFDIASQGQTSANVSVPEAVSSASFAVSDKLFVKQYRKIGSEEMVTFEPYEKIAKARDEEAYINFSIIPKKGVAYTPTELSFNASKIGTSGGTFDIVAIADGVQTDIASGENPERNGTGNSFTNYKYDISKVGTVNERLELRLYVYNLDAGKEFGTGDFTVTGDFKGTPVPVPSYTLSVTTENAEAGSVSSNPAGAEFDEGTSITVSATENFGYHFAAWVDETGETVSTDNPYTFEISGNTTLKATYTKNNVYALNVKLEGGANANLVQFAPEGNVVDGVHWYEEGTDVVLTALNNRILTFTTWEDNTTDATRKVKMDGQKDFTATFSSVDYIVGWDFYYDNPASERSADYKAETENGGLMSLRTEDGKTSTWLANGVEKGQYNGKYAARSWRPLADHYYFEASFSTIGYQNIVMAASLGNNFNSHETIYAQYSTDGKAFTTFGTYTMPNKGWNTQEIALPAEAANQQLLYIRFMPDWNSPLVGNEAETDGLAITDVFILADREIVDDDTAPKLISTLPEDKAEGVTANGSVILTFDEKVQAAGGGKATLGGEELEPTVSGKTVVYRYSGLDYSTQYTFTLPAGAIEDRSGNAFEGVEITFRTMDRQQPEARVYDAVVAQDGTGDYTTVQAAVDAAPADRISPWLIFIKAGKYKEHVDIPENKPFLHFIGQGKDVVEITDDKLCGGDNALHVDVGATFVAKSADLYFEGISFVNSYGVETNDGPQALALNTKNDRVVFKDCGMYSYQDTWITPSASDTRGYVKNCFIEGAVDFIYNNGDYFFDECTLNIVRKSGGYIVAPSHDADSKWGYVFMNNTITAPGNPAETDVWLGRPWHNQPKTVFINTTAEVTIPATGWYETMGGIPAIFAEYNTMDADGNPVDLTHRNTYYWYEDDGGQKVEGYAKAVLTAEEAAEYTIKNVLRGDDNWQPEIITEACAAPQPKLNEADGTLEWEAVPYAICYVITKNGEVEGFTTETSCAYTEGSEYAIQAANEYGGLSAKGTVDGTTTGIGSVETEGELTLKGIYSVDGTKLAAAQKGLNILVYTTADGKTVVRKVLK